MWAIDSPNVPSVSCHHTAWPLCVGRHRGQGTHSRPVRSACGRDLGSGDGTVVCCDLLMSHGDHWRCIFPDLENGIGRALEWVPRGPVVGQREDPTFVVPGGGTGATVSAPISSWFEVNGVSEHTCILPSRRLVQDAYMRCHSGGELWSGGAHLGSGWRCGGDIFRSALRSKPG